RKRIEECFGWLKTIALLRKVRHRGLFKVGWVFTFACAAYNLVRLRNLFRLKTCVCGSTPLFQSRVLCVFQLTPRHSS
ncbi:MAG TPA: transposase, partial [Terriglobales bacterium]